MKKTLCVVMCMCAFVMCAGPTRADDATELDTRVPFVYGAIVAHVTCFATTNAQLRKRLLLVSDVLAYCLFEQSHDAILSAASYNIVSAAAQNCGTQDYSVTDQIVYGSYADGDEALLRVKALVRSSAEYFDLFGKIVYSNSVYSTKCK